MHICLSLSPKLCKMKSVQMMISFMVTWPQYLNKLNHKKSLRKLKPCGFSRYSSCMYNMDRVSTD